MRTIKCPIVILVLIALVSCKSKSPDTFGADSIVNLYGGTCTYSIGFSASTKTSNKKYVEIALENSDKLQRFIDNPDLPASNIACLSYLQYSKAHKDFDFLRVVLNFKTGPKKTFEFDKGHLDIILNKMNILNHAVNLIKMKDFSGLEKIMDDKSVFNYDKHLLVQSIKEKDETLGVVKKFISVGFTFYTKNQQELLHISGVVERSLINHELSIDVSAKPGADNILKLQFTR